MSTARTLNVAGSHGANGVKDQGEWISDGDHSKGPFALAAAAEVMFELLESVPPAWLRSNGHSAWAHNGHGGSTNGGHIGVGTGQS